MRKNNGTSRRYCRKALERIHEIETKHPQGISDTTQIREEARAWIEKKIGQLRECLKPVWFDKGKPQWWERVRLSRNKANHQTEDLSDEEFSKICSDFFQDMPQIKTDLENNIKKIKQPSKEKRKFENFASPDFGSEPDRKQLVDAMEDTLNPIGPKEELIAFPKNNFSNSAEKVLNDILNNAEVKNYTTSHAGLSENIQTDILKWLQQTQSKLSKENPFLEEAVFIEQQKKLQAVELAEDITKEQSNIQMLYKQLPSINTETCGSIAASSLDFNFYRNAFSSQKKVKSKEKLEALRRNFIADMEQNFIDRKNKWELEQIEAVRKKFFEDLLKKIQNFVKLENLLSPFIKNFGRLWDLSSGIFETSGFEILETFAQLLERDESLQELAALLGKHNRAQAVFEKELRDKTVIKTEWHPQPAYRGEINGLRFSNDIASVLPSELAMMRNIAAKKLFQLKFAQKQLFSFDYQRDEEILKTETVQEEVSREKEEPKGPIIICVDTSGSMHGTPENIAKTVTFALAKIAMEQERNCYLISFSTGIETLDLSSGQGGTSLKKLVHFLRMSFNGGTDAAPALTHAVKMLHEDNYKNADVLMISDFTMNNLPADLIQSIKAEQEKHTDFYSLVIGTSGNKNTIACFNHNWIYDTNDRHAARRLVEQLHTIKTRQPI